MKAVRNEHGVTLIELLASLAILSIILVSIMNFFPQMGLINNHNEAKGQGINSVKQVLNDWKTAPAVIAFLKTHNVADRPAGYVSDDTTYYYFETTERNFKVKIKIKKSSDLTPPESTVGTGANAHQIHIQIVNERDVIISETYGYVIVE
jgi:prepilin-type N-terminal cleavage/methylation domain-containing protein